MLLHLQILNLESKLADSQQVIVNLESSLAQSRNEVTTLSSKLEELNQELSNKNSRLREVCAEAKKEEQEKKIHQDEAKCLKLELIKLERSLQNVSRRTI